MNCQRNVNSTLFTQLPHKFSYVVAIFIHNNFESPNIIIFHLICFKFIIAKYLIFSHLTIGERRSREGDDSSYSRERSASVHRTQV
jgi:hypothetical protein